MQHLDAVIIGAQKAATTGLYRTLATHPDVVAPRVQEAVVLHLGADGWEPWLRNTEPQVYRHPEGGALLAKLATAMYFDDTLGTIRKLNSSAHVIAIFRHPVDRMLSLHRYAAQRGLETRAPEDALRSDVVEKARDWRLRRYSEGSRYADAVDRVRRTFGSAALFVDYADVHSGACSAEVQDFLGLPPRDVHSVRANESRDARCAIMARAIESPALRRVVKRAVPARWRSRLREGLEQWNATDHAATQAPISSAYRAQLVERHMPDVVAAEAAMGRALPHWHS